MDEPMHHDELVVDEDLVAGLLADQLPDLAGLPLHRLGATGSSNVMLRLGDDLCVRMPRQPGADETSPRWSRLVGAALPVATPELVASGRPGRGYPEPWTVVRWIEGDVPAAGSGGPVLARDLADVLRALHALEVPAEARGDVALRRYRGEPLARQDAAMRADLEACRALPDLDLDLAAAARVWDAAVRLPAQDPHVRRWFHGDLFAENLLVRDGRLAAVLDLGGLGVGDPTVDLAGAWELLDAAGRDELRRVLAVDGATWLRGRAWALRIAVMTFPYYWRSMPGRCADRLVAARAVLADAAET